MMKNYELIMLCARFDFGETKAIAKAVLVALASYYNEEHAGSWPGQKNLLPCASCDRKSLISSIAWLESRNLIYIDRLLGKGNFYRFNIDLLKTGSQTSTSPENGTSPEKGTSPENGSTPVPNMGLHQSQKGDHTSPKNGTQNINKKERLNKKEINTYAEGEESSTNKPKKEREALTHLFELESLPEEWRNYSLQTRPDLNPETVFTAFKAYWTLGRGSGTRRSDKGWTQSWFNWVRNEREARNSGKVNGYTPQVTTGPKTLEPDWSQIDYGEGGFL